MTASNFQILAAEWPALFEAAAKAEALIDSHLRAACFYVRRALEQAVRRLDRVDDSLRVAYQDHPSALLVLP